MTFLHPGRLWWLLAAVLIGAVYVLLNRRMHAGQPATRSRIHLVLPKDSALKRHLSVISSLLAMSSLILAWAQPAAVRAVPRDQATIVIAVDISFSMRAEDVIPNRIEAAQQAASAFIDILPPSMQLSLVLFGGEVTMKTVPSTDHDAIKAALNKVELVPATAIGSAIEAGLEMIAAGSSEQDKLPPAAIVLLSDGYSNAGPSSSVAAQKAHDAQVPIYTIAFGTDDGFVLADGKRKAVPVNHAELMNIAKISGGEKYAAESVYDLDLIYKTLAESLGRVEQQVEITDQYAGIALLCALLSALGIISLAARWP